jgi:hypothetical protein
MLVGAFAYRVPPEGWKPAGYVCVAPVAPLCVRVCVGVWVYVYVCDV